MSERGQTLINIVRQKAAAEPDFVYVYPGETETCLYVHQGKPSCLIGQALFVTGLIDASLEKTPLNADICTTLFYHLELELDEDEISWLRAVQSKQDNGTAWADSVTWADRHGEVYRDEDAA